MSVNRHNSPYSAAVTGCGFIPDETAALTSVFGSRCLLSQAWKIIPSGSRYYSLRIKGTTVALKNANDVLISVCENVVRYKARPLLIAMALYYPNWLRLNPKGMNCPHRISAKCYLNLDGSGMTPIARAAKLLEWVKWPKWDVVITFIPPDSSRLPTVRLEPIPVDVTQPSPEKPLQEHIAKQDFVPKKIATEEGFFAIMIQKR